MNKIGSNFSIPLRVSKYKDEMFLDTLDSDYDRGSLTGLQGSLLDISVKTDNLNDDVPVVSDSDRDASSVGCESENEDSDFILCPIYK